MFSKLNSAEKKSWAVSSCAFLIKEVLIKPSIFRTKRKKGQSFRTREVKLLLPLVLRAERISGTMNEKKTMKGLRKSDWILATVVSGPRIHHFITCPQLSSE